MVEYGSAMATISRTEDSTRALSIRVLVVEDYEPFRRYICSMLEKRSELHIVGEAPDGLEGVQQGEELRPDLILLHVGLPTLNGMEAADESAMSLLSPKYFS